MSKNGILPWSPEEYDALRALAADSSLTAAVIRAEINAAFGNARTRNAILGAAHRMGLTVGRPNKGVVTSAKKRKGKGEGRLRDRFKEKLRQRKRRTPPVSPANYEKMAADLFVIDGGRLPKGPPYGMQDLTSKICRWIDGDPRAERPFACDEPKVLGKPYCVGHCKRSWGPSHKGRMAV